MAEAFEKVAIAGLHVILEPAWAVTPSVCMVTAYRGKLCITYQMPVSRKRVSALLNTYARNTNGCNG